MMDIEGLIGRIESTSGDKASDVVSGEISALEERLERQIKHMESDTRSWVTIGFVAGLFALIILGGLYVLWHNERLFNLMVEAKKSGVDVSLDGVGFLSFESVFSLLLNGFGTSLGFIIGYYFKERGR